MTQSGGPDPAGTVSEHAHRVAALAERFAAAWGAGWEGRAAGLLCDPGETGELFRAVPEVTGQQADPGAPGARAALARYGREGIAIALAIQGRGAGLGSAQLGALEAGLRTGTPGWDGLPSSSAGAGAWPEAGESRLAKHLAAGLPGAAMLDARMLLSALVDADYLATEAHLAGSEPGYRARAGSLTLSPERGLGLLRAYVERVQAHAAVRGASPELLSLRDSLMRAALEAGEQAPGLYTLTAPTGSGKTLAMLGFALRHARAHGLRRIVVVLPYLSIIDQLAQVYRRVFAGMPPGYVLEDHSLAAEPGGHEDPERLLAENWDAPIIVTTTVRFFESLFAGTPADCRKLHRLARSVILLDEAQSMPVDLVVPALAALSHLRSGYGASVLCASATRPALEIACGRAGSHESRSVAGWTPEETAGPGLRAPGPHGRARVEWPHGTTGWAEVAAAIAAERQALVIVNLRRHAAELFRAVHRAGTADALHLSTGMCPAHRLQVLDRARVRLRNGLPCRLIATQCVEAGVDLDFPVVWRALAPLDAIVQAAGRCNREGTLAVGVVHVFLPPPGPVMAPSGDYEHGAVTLQQMLAAQPGLDPLDPGVAQEYFRRYYRVDGPENETGSELADAIRALDFGETSRRSRWIDGKGLNMLVPYSPRKAIFAELAAQASARGITAGWLREARGLAVAVRGPVTRSLSYLSDEVKTLSGAPTGWHILLQESAYDPDTGLNLDEGPAGSRTVA